MDEQIPIYLFNGFLEAGKTSFIIEQMNDAEFNQGEKTLIIICEDGEVEFDQSSAAFFNSKFEFVESEEDLTCDYLEGLAMKYPDVEQILIEYNGMWKLSTLQMALPEQWLLYQQLFIADSNTFMAYNTMFRNLMFEKLSNSEVVIFNRCSKGLDRLPLHKIARAANRRIAINYQLTNGNYEFDDIEDPLPFDDKADFITIDFDDYAYWFRDMAEETTKYNGKTLQITGFVFDNTILKQRGFSFGRQVMTCCVEDIKFMGLPCFNNTGKSIEMNKWYTITGKFRYGYVKEFKKKYPVFEVSEMKQETEPKNPIATF